MSRTLFCLLWTGIAFAGIALVVSSGNADCCRIPAGTTPTTPPPPVPPPDPPPVVPPPMLGGDDVPGYSPYGDDDSGMFGTGRSRTFREPVQQAVIAWNGKEEVLVLSVQQQHVVEGGTLISVLPLPGRPIGVDRADAKLFSKAQSLYVDKLKAMGEVPGRSFQVLITKDIGAHHIVIVEAKDHNTFVDSIQGYVRKRVKNGHAVLSDEANKVIKGYLAAGFKYFAFDLEKSSTKMHTKEAIAYHFESDWLYYPLLISKVGGTGNTRVQLFVITPREVNFFRGLKESRIVSKNSSVTLTPEEIRTLDPTMGKVMAGRPARARIWTITGKLDGFEADLFAKYRDPVK